MKKQNPLTDKNYERKFNMTNKQRREMFRFSTKDYSIEDHNGNVLSTRKEHQILKKLGYMKRTNGLWHATQKMGNNNYYTYIHITGSQYHRSYDYQLWSMKGFKKLNSIFVNFGYFIPDYVPTNEWGIKATHIIKGKKNLIKELLDSSQHITNPKKRNQVQKILKQPRINRKQLQKLTLEFGNEFINKLSKKHNQLINSIKKLQNKDDNYDTNNSRAN